MDKMKQTDRVVQYMKEFGSITPLDALRDLGVMRLASRITDLRKLGYAIVKETVTGKDRWGNTTHYARYRMAE